MPTGLRRILQEAIEAVPAVRYAAGITGIGAAVAIVASFRLGPAIAVLGVVVTLGLMAVLLAFARVAAVSAGNRGAVLDAGVVMVWVFTLLVCVTGIMLFTMTFFGVPRTWHDLTGPSISAHGQRIGAAGSGKRVPGSVATTPPPNAFNHDDTLR
jgi:hypothetical protein